MAMGITATCKKERGITFLAFTGEATQLELQKIFSEAYALLGDLREIKMILDLSKVPYINSGFIGHLSELYAMVEENEGKMVIVGNAIINDTFDLVGFAEFVNIVATENDAVEILEYYIKTKEFDFHFMD